MFRPLSRIAAVIGIGYNNAAFVGLDALASQVLRWNNHYHRDTIWKKIAPGSVFYMLEKILTVEKVRTQLPVQSVTALGHE